MVAMLRFVAGSRQGIGGGEKILHVSLLQEERATRGEVRGGIEQAERVVRKVEESRNKALRQKSLAGNTGDLLGPIPGFLIPNQCESDPIMGTGG